MNGHMHLYLVYRLKEQIQPVLRLGNMTKETQKDTNFHPGPPPSLFFLLNKNLPRWRQQDSTDTQERPQANSKLLWSSTALLTWALSSAGLWQHPLSTFIHNRGQSQSICTTIPPAERPRHDGRRQLQANEAYCCWQSTGIAIFLLSPLTYHCHQQLLPAQCFKAKSGKVLSLLILPVTIAFHTEILHC